MRVENSAQLGTVGEAQIVSGGKKWNVMKLEIEMNEPAREAQLHGLGLYCKLYNHLKIGPSLKFSNSWIKPRQIPRILQLLVC